MFELVYPLARYVHVLSKFCWCVKSCLLKNVCYELFKKSHFFLLMSFGMRYNDCILLLWFEVTMEENNPLINAQVFYRHRTKLGIPSEVFLLVAFVNVFAILFCIIHYSLPLILFYVVFFLVSVVPLKYIFKEDPQSHRAWISGLMKSARISNGAYIKRNVKFM
ncbi:hypothetical protein FT976_19905 [Salmonella enterica]|nr:hypothetical protein [Salmonella enterica]